MFPSFLVGEGARMWAKSKGIPLPASIPEADEVNSLSFLPYLSKFPFPYISIFFLEYVGLKFL